jgi:hypothetical protein
MRASRESTKSPETEILNIEEACDTHRGNKDYIEGALIFAVM